MTSIRDTDRARLPLGKRGAFEGVARRHGRRRNPARRPPRTPVRTPTNPPRHSTQRWVEKCDRSVANSETPQVLGAISLLALPPIITLIRRDQHPDTIANPTIHQAQTALANTN
jgi:hypothetical protein